MQTTNYLQAKESFFLASQVEGKSRRTLELYEESLKNFEQFLKDKDLLSANATDIRQFLFSLEKQGFAKATLYTHHNELRVFYNFLLSEGYISENPMKGIKAPKMPRVYPYVLSEEEAHEDRFFISRAGEPMNRNSVLQMLKRLSKRANIKNKRVSPHTFRHTSATFWIKNGGDTVSLRIQLGHVDTRMVDVYVNLVGKDLRDAHRKYSPVSRLIIKKRG